MSQTTENSSTERKISISLCILARNEADNLKSCLKNAGGIVDEILLLDTGSTDNTAETARKLGAEVFEFDWDNDFASARNFLLNKAKGEWILWIDADEHYPPELIIEITESIRNRSEYAGFYFPRKNHYFGRWLKYGRNYPDYQMKLFRVSASEGYKNRVHEKVRLNGKTGRLKNACEHHPYPNIKSYFKKFDEYTTLEAKKLLENGEQISFMNGLKWLYVKPVIRFFKRYIVYGGFLNGLPGLFAAMFDSAGFIVRYFKLWEMKSAEKRI